MKSLDLMTPDKATVELVAKAIEREEWRLSYEDEECLDTHYHTLAEAALAALPTPTDASGLVGALELIASCATSDPNFWMVAVAEKALAHHRAGNPWSDVAPTEGLKLAREDQLLEESIYPVMFEADSTAYVMWGGKFYGPITPPEGI